MIGEDAVCSLWDEGFLYRIICLFPIIDLFIISLICQG